MPKYLIQYNVGDGPNSYVVKAKNQIEADEKAHDAAHEAFEERAFYDARLLTPELAKEFGHMDELEDAVLGSKT